MFKRFNLQIGIPLSLLCAGSAVLLSFIKMDRENTAQFLVLSYYYFGFALLSWIGNHYLIEYTATKNRAYNGILFYGCSIIAGCIFALLFDNLNTLLSGKMLFVYQIKSTEDTKRLLMICLRGLMTNGLNALIVYHLNQMRIKERNVLELEHLKQAQLQANLSTLKEQLSPHFLFNTFNTLSSLTQEQSVKDYVEEMANVYRYVLDYHQKDLATLQQELEFTTSYLYIIQTRMEQAIQVHINIDPQCLTCVIPPLTLQLLIENAMKHNITATLKPLVIHIYTKAGQLVVANNLQPKIAVQASSGIGLNNIAQRYQLLFGQDIHIETDHEMFTVTLPLSL